MEIEKSLPTRGAWIEIRPWLPAHPAAQSLPPRGAWIEISTRQHVRTSRVVAPHTGSVD